MFLLGLTGPTGAGKGVVADELKTRGFAAIDADSTARAVVRPGSRCLRELALAFGSDIICSDGSLDRKKLASLAFKDKDSTAMLNRITHPHITEEIKKELDRLCGDGYKYVVLDAPALYESGEDSICDRVLAVTASERERLSRIMIRDGLTEKEAMQRIKAQPGSDFYTGRADYVIANDGTAEQLKSKAAELAAEIFEGV